VIKNKFPKKCSQCGKEFIVWRYRLLAKFCSKKCADIFKTGKPHASKTKFFKGQPAWNKGKKWPKKSIEKMRLAHIGKLTGKNNPRWKGDNIKYGGLHDWIWLCKGRPTKCEHCGTTTAKKFEWANKNHTYKRNLFDYISLCTSCHRKYDIKYNNYQNHSLKI
jgi:hypothetical protein